MIKHTGAMKKSVSLYDLDRKIVNELARAKGLDFSSALRMILREWQDARKVSKSQEHVIQ